MNTQFTTPRSHFVFLDLIRFISILVIVPFHLSEFSFDSETHPIYVGSLLNTSLIKFAKLIPFSGHTVLLLSLFLIGYGNLTSKKLFRLLAWCAVGYLIILFSYYESPYPLFYWDVFSFLFCSLLLCFAFLAIPYGFFIALLFGLGTSSHEIINWNIEALGGICSSQYESAWPLLPWGFYGAALACLGRDLRDRKQPGLPALQAQIYHHSKWIFPALLVSAFFILRGITEVPPTGGMYCFIQKFSFTQKVFLMVCWVILFLYGTHEEANARWGKSWLKYLSQISWNKNFAMAYLIQIGLIGVLTSKPEMFLATSLRYDAALIVAFLGTELIFYLISRNMNRRT